MYKSSSLRLENQHTGLANDTTYYYVITATNGTGEGPASTEVQATPFEIASAPSAPLRVVASAGNATNTIAWSPVIGASTYNIYWSTTSGAGASGTQVQNVISPYAHSGLANGTAYYYVVTAVGAGGESAVSTQVNATPTAPSNPPTIPAGIAAAVGDGRYRNVRCWRLCRGGTRR